MTVPLDLWVFGSSLMNGHGSAGEELGRFSCHWAACAAMIRFTSPEFVSTGGDKAADIGLEHAIRQKLADRARLGECLKAQGIIT